MRARTFISLMLLLLGFTTVLLVLSVPAKQQKQKSEYPAGVQGNDNTQTQASDGSIFIESISSHLLSAVQ